jgi:hypothetical protein
MGSRQTLFFAIDDDLYSILALIEQEFAIEYVLMGRFETTTEIVQYLSFSEIPDFGLTKYGDWAGPDHGYMIKSSRSTLSIEEFKLSKGGVVYLIDMKLNPDTLEFTPKGIYTRKENVIIAGRVATIADGPFSSTIYKSLSSKIRKKFKRIGVFYVGPKAEEKLKEGWRLVQIENSPREYDLAYPK